MCSEIILWAIIAILFSIGCLILTLAVHMILDNKRDKIYKKCKTLLQENFELKKKLNENTNTTTKKRI